MTASASTLALHILHLLWDQRTVTFEGGAQQVLAQLKFIGRSKICGINSKLFNLSSGIINKQFQTTVLLGEINASEVTETFASTALLTDTIITPYEVP
jgi:hypothetical protein